MAVGPFSAITWIVVSSPFVSDAWAVSASDAAEASVLSSGAAVSAWLSVCDAVVCAAVVSEVSAAPVQPAKRAAVSETIQVSDSAFFISILLF